LEKLIAQRQAFILKLEAVVAKQQGQAAVAAKKGKRGSGQAIQIKVQRKRVNAEQHYESQISRLNADIDKARHEILSSLGSGSTRHSAPTPSLQGGGGADGDGIEVHDTGIRVTPQSATIEASRRTTTAFVTFTSLRAKQAALQCAITDDPDRIVVVPAYDPASTLWSNAHVPLPHQQYLQALASAFFVVGILFWAFPMAGLALFNNLNSFLALFDTSVDPTAPWYGLVSGLLPVVALAVLMMVLYMIITMSATKFIRYKSWPEVDSHCLFWHTLFQFANLWFIVIGGSLFNLFNNIESLNFDDIVRTVATAMPGQAVFFINMIVVSSFGAFGLELSMIPKHAVTFIMGLISPPEARTQRELDSGQKPPSIVWGQIMPPIIFIFLVMFIYSTCCWNRHLSCDLRILTLSLITLFAALAFRCTRCSADCAHCGGFQLGVLFWHVLGLETPMLACIRARV
jgi:Calcium-dependent channel, 7TM region, putative phosphate